MQTRIKHYNGRLFQILTAKDFLNVIKDNKDAIKTSRFVLPKVGSKSFGKFYVEYYYAPTPKQTAASYPDTGRLGSRAYKIINSPAESKVAAGAAEIGIREDETRPECHVG